MITAEVQLIFNISLKEALRLRHEYILCEHLLYSICHNSYGEKILTQAGVDLPKVKESLEDHLETQLHQITKSDDEFTPATSVGVERVIHYALEHCANSSKQRCDLGDILIAMLQEKDSFAVYYLYQHGLDKYELVRSAATESHAEEDGEEESGRSGSAEKRQTLLEKYTVSLNALARSKKIDPLIGRKDELAKILSVLSRRKKNNPLLVGEPGVGKTAIVEGLALQIEEGEIHPFFKNFQVYALDMTALLAGTRFRGDFEERIKKLFETFKEQERLIVFIDELHIIVGSGTAGSSHLDTANLLKPFLTRGDIRIIGATTYQEYRGQLQKDHALSRRFEKIDIPEPSHEETLEILNRLKSHYASYHNVDYSEDALPKMVELSKNYLKEKHLPDSAIDVLDITGAMVKLDRFAEIQPTVTESDVEKAVSRLANVPLKKIDHEEKANIRDLEANLKQRIFGQDHAVEKVVKAVKLSKSLLSEADKPIASFLFTGPTGVGKTELARTLAEELHLKVIRLDMSEYMEAHSVSKIIGAPPGYVGYNDVNNQLTEQIRKHPHALVLLDEIEKAHADVLNVFLQVMDYGTLTDNNGAKVDFTHAILVMTSNAGAKELTEPLIGFMESDGEFKAKMEINKTFLPEFRNRLSAIIAFKFLSIKLAAKITRKFIEEVNHALKPKQVELSLSEDALHYLTQKGFDLRMGARPLKRIIEKHLKEPLIDEILFGKLSEGGRAIFSLHEEGLRYAIEALPTSKDAGDDSLTKANMDDKPAKTNTSDKAAKTDADSHSKKANEVHQSNEASTDRRSKKDNANDAK